MAKAKTPGTGNSHKKHVATLSGASRSLGMNNGFTPAGLDAEIRRRAYELYERRGCTPGHENEDWLIAEREVVGRYQHQGA